ncbi:MAG: hypothetical protein AAF578_03340 [Pseudomonadota bacterium]
MTLQTAQVLVAIGSAYVGVGLLVALIYVFGGAGKIDPAARGSGMPPSVRLLIAPGVIGLWPLMLYKLAVQKVPPVS